MALAILRGLDPKTGKPLEYDPKLDAQTYVPEARAFHGMKRTRTPGPPLPTL